MTDLYSVMEHLTVGDTIFWTASAEQRDTNYSTVDAIIEMADTVEIRVSGPQGGQYTLDFPDDDTPTTHWHPPEESKETHIDAGHQVRRGEVYVGRGPLTMLAIVGRAEDTSEGEATQPLREELQ